MQIWFIISLIFSLIIGVFAALNSDVVTIRLIFAKYQLSESLVIIMSAAIGAMITIFLGLFSKIKTKLKIRELNNEIKAANTKIAELKAALSKIEGGALASPNKVDEVKK